MRRLALNRLWVQISLVIAGVVLVAALALLGAGSLRMRRND